MEDKIYNSEEEYLLEQVKEAIDNGVIELPRGEDGHTPTDEELIALIKPLIPIVKDGENYILTEQDKRDIAKSIKVPVVEKVIEKTEVVRETPIVKEVAVSDTPEVIKDKLETLDGDKRLKIEAIKDLREELDKVKARGGEHVVSTSNRGLYQLLDVNVSGIVAGQSIYWDGSQWLPVTFTVEDKYYNVATNYTALDENQTIIATQPITISLPQITATRKKITISNQSTGEVTVNAFSGDLVHDDTSLIISYHNSTAQLLSSSEGWIIV